MLRGKQRFLSVMSLGLMGFSVLLAGALSEAGPKPKPTAPYIHRATVDESGEVSLQFTASKNVTQYEVRLGNPERSTRIAQLGASSTSYSTKRLANPGELVSLFVRAVGQGGSADSNVVKLRIPAPRYAKPLATFPETGGYLGFGAEVSGKRHNGGDYKSAVGTAVFAVTDGVVVYSGSYEGFGSLNPSSKGGVMVVEHTNRSGARFFAVYGHATPLVKPGARVTKGQQIGTIHMFKNGGVALPHLHFGIYIGDRFPTSGWGYSSSLANWAEPKAYLDSNL